jgi:hypothetical protein
MARPSCFQLSKIEVLDIKTSNFQPFQLFSDLGRIQILKSEAIFLHLPQNFCMCNFKDRSFIEEKQFSFSFLLHKNCVLEIRKTTFV